MDGESMSDWYTGSSNVLIKVLVRCVFGINPAPDGLYICPAAYSPVDKKSISVKVRDAAVTVEISGKKKDFFVNGKKAEAAYDKFQKTYSLFIPAKDLKGDIKVEVK